MLRSLDPSISTAGDVTSSGADADAGRISELQSLVLESTDLCQAATDRAKTAEERMQQVRVCVPFPFCHWTVFDLRLMMMLSFRSNVKSWEKAFKHSA
jgi:hypothetical protein